MIKTILVFVSIFGACISVDVGCFPRQAGSHWKPDPHDCSKFFLCFNGQRFNFSCANSVWDINTKTCVGKGSRWDKCTIKNELENLTPCSNDGVEMAAKGDNCAQYYDCASRKTSISSDPHLKECPYPLLFNDESARCEPYNMVTCGERMEPKDPCAYEANQCRASHCVPCNVRFPSCSGQRDGLNAWVGREWSPFFVVCQEERMVYQGQCDLGHAVELFNPEKRMCEEVKDERVLEGHMRP